MQWPRAAGFGCIRCALPLTPCPRNGIKARALLGRSCGMAKQGLVFGEGQPDSGDRVVLARGRREAIARSGRWPDIRCAQRMLAHWLLWPRAPRLGVVAGFGLPPEAPTFGGVPAHGVQEYLVVGKTSTSACLRSSDHFEIFEGLSRPIHKELDTPFERSHPLWSGQILQPPAVARGSMVQFYRLPPQSCQRPEIRLSTDQHTQHDPRLLLDSNRRRRSQRHSI